VDSYALGLCTVYRYKIKSDNGVKSFDQSSVFRGQPGFGLVDPGHDYATGQRGFPAPVTSHWIGSTKSRIGQLQSNVG